MNTDVLACPTPLFSFFDTSTSTEVLGNLSSVTQDLGALLWPIAESGNMTQARTIGIALLRMWILGRSSFRTEKGS